MAGAPHKQGLDYISIDVSIFDEPGILLLEDQLPDRGFKFYMYFMCFAGKKSHFIKWDVLTRIEFCKAYNVQKEEAIKVLEILLAVGLFDADLFKKYGVISSAEMQYKYLRATYRRQYSIFIQDYLLIDLDSYKKKKHVVLQDTKGNTLIDFSKGKLRVTKPKAPVKKTQPSTPPPPEPESNTFTAQDLMNYISVPYAGRSAIFKKDWSEKWYSSYVKFSNAIHGKQNLRICKFQLTLPKYKEIIDNHKPTEKELLDAIDKLSKKGINEGQMMELRIPDAIKWVREDAAKHIPGNGINGQPLKPMMKKPLLYDGTKKGGLNQ